MRDRIGAVVGAVGLGLRPHPEGRDEQVPRLGSRYRLVLGRTHRETRVEVPIDREAGVDIAIEPEHAVTTRAEQQGEPVQTAGRHQLHYKPGGANVSGVGTPSHSHTKSCLLYTSPSPRDGLL